jgi:hypothetical protein
MIVIYCEGFTIAEPIRNRKILENWLRKEIFAVRIDQRSRSSMDRIEVS